MALSDKNKYVIFIGIFCAWMLYYAVNGLTILTGSYTLGDLTFSADFLNAFFKILIYLLVVFIGGFTTKKLLYN